jgi:hypothetical protein
MVSPRLLMEDTRVRNSLVRLGNSGLKVSKIILGCMSYGSPEWQAWVLPEEESIKQIKAACVCHCIKHSIYLSNDCIGMTLASIPLTRRTQVYPI